jgi:DNA-3-methyladenine glycosylase I
MAEHDHLHVGDDGIARCRWGAGPDALYMTYHDTEWGRPVVDDRRLFEKLCLEGFQSGLSWLTILRKRENFRTAFAGFDPERVASFGDRDIERLLGDVGIVRHRGKITSTINNAARMIDLCEQVGSLAAYVWGFEPSEPHRPGGGPDSIPATSPASVAMSKDLKKRGWSFVGPTTVYSFMQAMGLTNDHVHGCHAWTACDAARTGLSRPG